MNDRLSKKNIKKLIKYHTTKLVDMILELEDYDFLYQEEHTINILRQARKVNSLHEKEELLRMRGN
jgi:glycyl-tRNA synthetase alpha subunit